MEASHLTSEISYHQISDLTKNFGFQGYTLQSKLGKVKLAEFKIVICAKVSIKHTLIKGYSKNISKTNLAFLNKLKIVMSLATLVTSFSSWQIFVGVMA